MEKVQLEGYGSLEQKLIIHQIQLMIPDHLMELNVFLEMPVFTGMEVILTTVIL